MPLRSRRKTVTPDIVEFVPSEFSKRTVETLKAIKDDYPSVSCWFAIQKAIDASGLPAKQVEPLLTRFQLSNDTVNQTATLGAAITASPNVTYQGSLGHITLELDALLSSGCNDMLSGLYLGHQFALENSLGESRSPKREDTIEALTTFFVQSATALLDLPD